MLPCLCLGNWLVTVKELLFVKTLRPNRSRDLKLVQGQGATVSGSGNVSHLCAPGVTMYVREMYIIVCLSGSRKTRRYYDLKKEKKNQVRNIYLPQVNHCRNVISPLAIKLVFWMAADMGIK